MQLLYTQGQSSRTGSVPQHFDMAARQADEVFEVCFANGWDAGILGLMIRQLVAQPYAGQVRAWDFMRNLFIACLGMELGIQRARKSKGSH